MARKRFKVNTSVPSFYQPSAMKPQHIRCPYLCKVASYTFATFLDGSSQLSLILFPAFEPQRSCLLPQSLALSRFSFARLVDLFEPRHALSPLAHPPKPHPLCGFGESRLSWQPPFPLGGDSRDNKETKDFQRKPRQVSFPLEYFF